MRHRQAVAKPPGAPPGTERSVWSTSGTEVHLRHHQEQVPRETPAGRINRPGHHRDHLCTLHTTTGHRLLDVQSLPPGSNTTSTSLTSMGLPSMSLSSVSLAIWSAQVYMKASRSLRTAPVLLRCFAYWRLLRLTLRLGAATMVDAELATTIRHDLSNRFCTRVLVSSPLVAPRQKFNAKKFQAPLVPVCNRRVRVGAWNFFVCLLLPGISLKLHAEAATTADRMGAITEEDMYEQPGRQERCACVWVLTRKAFLFFGLQPCTSQMIPAVTTNSDTGMYLHIATPLFLAILHTCTFTNMHTSASASLSLTFTQALQPRRRSKPKVLQLSGQPSWSALHQTPMSAHLPAADTARFLRAANPRCRRRPLRATSDALTNCAASGSNPSPSAAKTQKQKNTKTRAQQTNERNKTSLVSPAEL